MTITVNKEEAIKTISTLLQSVQEGNEVLIEEEGNVLARLSPEPPKKRRIPNTARGRAIALPGCFDPMTDEELREIGLL